MRRLARAAAAAMAVVVAGVVAGGCASATSAYAGWDGLAARVAEGALAVPAERAAGQPRALPPGRLRIAVVGTERNPNGTFADLDSASLETALLARDGLFADVVGLPGFLDGGGTERNLDSLRRVARQAQADALLVYETRMEVQDATTPLIVLNAAVLPAWIVPSKTWEISLDTRAALVDPVTGTVWTTVRDARRDDGMVPSALAGSSARQTKRDMRAATFEALAEAVDGKIARLRETVETR